MVDRGLWSSDRWRQAAATGAALLWRVKISPSSGAPTLPVDQVLADGSWRSQLAADCHGTPIVVRVVDYHLDDPGLARRGGHGTRARARPRDLPADGQMVYRLVTSILDPELAPAAELAALYHQRWEFETTLAELKIAQRGRCAVLRSKTPAGVTQEVWAHLLVHYALRP
jgi:Transposase DDE domain